jgi:hypothetical protein
MGEVSVRPWIGGIPDKLGLNNSQRWLVLVKAIDDCPIREEANGQTARSAKCKRSGI